MVRTLFTLTGCNACKLLKEKYAKEISEGKIKVIDCSANETTDDEIAQCVTIVESDIFNGFPFLTDNIEKE